MCGVCRISAALRGGLGSRKGTWCCAHDSTETVQTVGLASFSPQVHAGAAASTPFHVGGACREQSQRLKWILPRQCSPTKLQKNEFPLVTASKKKSSSVLSSSLSKPHWAPFSFLFSFLVFGSYPEACSKVTPGSVLRNRFWQARGTVWDAGIRTIVSWIRQGKANVLLMCCLSGPVLRF